jgi:hypothetical protein
VARQTASEGDTDTQVRVVGDALWFDAALVEVSEEALRESNAPRRPKVHKEPHPGANTRHEGRHRIVDRQRAKDVEPITPTAPKAVSHERIEPEERHWT